MAVGPEDVDIAASAARGSSPPEDRRGFVYRACFFLGAGILFPWNSYITAVDYFERVHPGKHVDRVFGVLYFLPNLLMLVLVLMCVLVCVLVLMPLLVPVLLPLLVLVLVIVIFLVLALVSVFKLVIVLKAVLVLVLMAMIMLMPAPCPCQCPW